MTSEEYIQNGREKLRRLGIVESETFENGKFLRPTVPGLGGAGSGLTFARNRLALSKYAIKTQLLGPHFLPNTKIKLFEQNLDFPILSSPMSGIETSLKGAIPESKFLEAVLSGCKSAGTVGMCGDSYITTGNYPVPAV